MVLPSTETKPLSPGRAPWATVLRSTTPHLLRAMPPWLGGTALRSSGLAPKVSSERREHCWTAILRCPRTRTHERCRRRVVAPGISCQGQPVSQVSRMSNRLLRGHSVKLTPVTPPADLSCFFEGVGGDDQRSSPIPIARPSGFGRPSPVNRFCPHGFDIRASHELITRILAHF